MMRHRLHLTGRPATGLRDHLRNRQEPCVWDADGLSVEVFLADLEDTAAEFDITTIAALTLEIRASKKDPDLLAGPIATDDALVACTMADFTDDAGQHAVFTLTGAQMNFAAGVTRFWMSIRATITGGQPVTFGAGWVTVAESAHGDTVDPAAAGSASGFLYLTSITPDDDGMHIFTCRGKQWRQALTDFEDDATTPAEYSHSPFVFLISTTADADGMYQFVSRGKTWRDFLPDFADA